MNIPNNESMSEVDPPACGTIPDFVLPRDVDFPSLLPLKLQLHADEARYLVSLVVHKSAFDDTDDDGFVRLTHANLRSIVSRRRLAAQQTGKSVVAVNLLVALTTTGRVAQYVTKNAAPRAV